MEKDRYKVERIRYEYESIDVGPGPSIRGNVLYMSSAFRNYRKTYDLEGAVKEFERQRKTFDEDEAVIIVSKLVDREYVPGKVTIDMNGQPAWQQAIKYYNFKWKRRDTRLPFFDLMSDKEYPIVHQDTFSKKDPTFSEVISNSPILSLYRSFKASQQKREDAKIIGAKAKPVKGGK